MDKLTLSFTIDLNNSDEVEKLKSWLDGATKNSPIEEEIEKKKPKKKKHEDIPENKSSISLDDLRSELAVKVKDYRADIKEKLTEFGAKNLSTLSEDRYEEMHEFLTDLS